MSQVNPSKLAIVLKYQYLEILQKFFYIKIRLAEVAELRDQEFWSPKEATIASACPLFQILHLPAPAD